MLSIRAAESGVGSGAARGHTQASVEGERSWNPGPRGGHLSSHAEYAGQTEQTILRAAKLSQLPEAARVRMVTRLTESFLMFPKASGSSCAMSILCKSLASNRMLCVESRVGSVATSLGAGPCTRALLCPRGPLDILHFGQGEREGGGARPLGEEFAPEELMTLVFDPGPWLAHPGNKGKDAPQIRLPCLPGAEALLYSAQGKWAQPASEPLRVVHCGRPSSRSPF